MFDSQGYISDTVVVGEEGAQTATVSHAYPFTGGSTFSGSGTVTVSDRAGNVAGVPFHHLENPGFWDIVEEGLNLFDIGDD